MSFKVGDIVVVIDLEKAKIQSYQGPQIGPVTYIDYKSKDLHITDNLSCWVSFDNVILATDLVKELL